jgi:predicted Zn-dependent protease
MSRKKLEQHRMKSSLADLLVQKHISVPLKSDDEDRFNLLEQENRALKDQVNRLQTEIEQLHHRYNDPIAQPGIDTESLFQQAVTELKSGNPIDALGLLQAIVILCPGHIRAMLNLAVVYAEMDMESRAMEMLKAVLLRDPNNATAQRNMNILMKQANS